MKIIIVAALVKTGCKSGLAFETGMTCILNCCQKYIKSIKKKKRYFYFSRLKITNLLVSRV